MFFLGFDCGGTNTRRGAFYRDAGGRFLPVLKDGKPLRDKVPTADFPGLVPMARQFLSANADTLGTDLPAAVGYGYAGALEDGKADAGINMPWGVDDAAMSSEFGCRFKGHNDLAVMFYGINFLEPSQIFLLAGDGARLQVPGRQLCLIAPGTGTGACPGHWTGTHYAPTLESEFGHIRFAPQDPEGRDDPYLKFLRERVRKASLESGVHLLNIYTYLRDVRRVGAEPEPIRRQIAAGMDPSPLICSTALGGGDELCQAALAMYARLIGAAASDLTLVFKAFGGCFIGGGNVVKIGTDYLQTSELVPTFVMVGHHEPRMRQTPVSILLAETGDWGAAYSVYLDHQAA